MKRAGSVTGNGTDIRSNGTRGKRRVGPTTESGHNRRNLILIAAADLFSRRGFRGTSMRDIAEVAGILAGSIYHHFNSKEDIFLAAHAAGIEQQRGAVLAALEGLTDPWDRLEAAAGAHLEILLEGKPVIFSTPWISNEITAYHDEIVSQRDSYEKMMNKLIEALPLPADTDRHLFRLHFLGALNWVPQWYKPGGELTPEQIGVGLVKMLKPHA